MKSGKQRRQEIKLKRIERAKKQQGSLSQSINPLYSIAADQSELLHNNTYGPLPLFYIDLLFICRDCSKEDVWTAKQQKWWFEIVKGNINSTAIRCRNCRKIEQERKAETRRVHLDGIAQKEK